MFPDLSVIAVIILFLTTVVALNKILIQPLFKVLDERDRRTRGALQESNKTLETYTILFERYQNSIREGRMAAYKLQEQARLEGLDKRAQILQEAKKKAEKVISDAKASISLEVQQAKASLANETKKIAHTISNLILRRQDMPPNKEVTLR